jgi:urease accessory protein UreE
VLFRGRRLRRITVPAADGKLHAWLHQNGEVASEILAGDDDLMMEVWLADEDVARLRASTPAIQVTE